MPTELEYSLLSATVYGNYHPVNRLPVPAGWTPIEGTLRSYSDASDLWGFQAQAFRKGNEVVIAYTGTNDAMIMDWVVGNIPLGVGLSSPQLLSAANLYLDVRDMLAGQDVSISFTGHSLGGGLASVMGVFFDKTVHAFDPAPFFAAAISPVAIGSVLASITAQGRADGSFTTYAASLGALYALREDNVGYTVLVGEALTFPPVSEALRIGSSNAPHYIDPAAQGRDDWGFLRRNVDMHSMNLLTAFVLKPGLDQASAAHANLLPEMHDRDFLYAEGTSSTLGFKEAMIKAHYAGSAVLDGFVQDLGKFVDLGAAAIPLVNRALIDITMQYYYQFAASGSVDWTQALTAVSGGVYFKADDFAVEVRPDIHGLALLDSYLNEAYGLDPRDDINQYFIQSGTGSLTAFGLDDSGNLMLGGVLTDALTGGNEDDVLLGWFGNDFLDGGEGEDFLQGGEAFDSYLYASGDGEDIILDSDGQGQISFDGLVLDGGKRKEGESVYTSRDGQYIYSWDGGDLSINDGAIVVRDFRNRDLGIFLDDKEDDPQDPNDPRNKNRDPFRRAETLPSPVILDLNGDGVVTTGLLAGAYFDHDGDGFAEMTGWASALDGLLAWDRNGDGRINDGSELFGDRTLLLNGSRAAHGFAALADLDANQDLVLDAADAAWSSLRVWIDADGNGYSSADELFELQAAGVQSIQTAYANSAVVDQHGNQHRQIGTYTRTDGTTGAAEDVWFRTDRMFSLAERRVEVAADIAALPDAEGFGTILSLRQAMAQDESGGLKLLVEEFVAATSLDERLELVDSII
jgi:hypothetical protein